MILIAELATSFHGNVDLGCEMIRAAAQAGATHVKTQAYSCSAINPSDPQYDWLVESWVSPDGHKALMACAERERVTYVSTPFDALSLQMLRDIGLKQFKIASSEATNQWWVDEPAMGEIWFVSYPWGNSEAINHPRRYHMTAIPLYPTPFEAIGRAPLLNGYSDHCEGISAAMWAIAQGVKVLEVHVTYPGARQMSWDKSMDDVKRLRDFAEDCQTMSSGVARKFRERWSA